MKYAKLLILIPILTLLWHSEAVSQYYYYDTYFGKNKVQYSDFDWKIIETEHFHVFYYPGERQLALDAARMAERAYTRLSRILSFEIKFPIPLVIYASHSNFQETNISLGLIDEGVGGFTTFLSKHAARSVSVGRGPLPSHPCSWAIVLSSAALRRPINPALAMVRSDCPDRIRYIA